MFLAIQLCIDTGSEAAKDFTLKTTNVGQNNQPQTTCKKAGRKQMRVRLKPKTSGSKQFSRRQLADEIECFEYAVPLGRLDTVQGDMRAFK